MMQQLGYKLDRNFRQNVEQKLRNMKVLNFSQLRPGIIALQTDLLVPGYSEKDPDLVFESAYRIYFDNSQLRLATQAKFDLLRRLNERNPRLKHERFLKSSLYHPYLPYAPVPFITSQEEVEDFAKRLIKQKDYLLIP